jgi:hypothetical protein
MRFPNWFISRLLSFALIAFTSLAAVAADQQINSPDCHVAEPDANTSVNIGAIDDYETFIRHLLVQRRYDSLDCIADAARANKTKFRGGFWKIHTIYTGLSNPVDDGAHATEADWNDHIDRLNRWISANPNSVTARIALAHSYIDFAWHARGNGFVDKVTDNGWRLVGERTRQAEEILKEAYKLPVKCPEWYLAAQALVQLQGTDKEQLTELLKRATELEPTYQYFYRQYDDLLAAKWYGDAGDEEKFAAEAADRIGGTEGDILYFQIASHAICPCSDGEVDLKLLSWPRMQKGFQALTEKSGPSLINLNLLAYMAIQERDPTVADQTFSRIGENWEDDLWRTKAFFDENKQWAAEVAPTMAWQKSIQDNADVDMRTPKALEMKKKFDEKFAEKIQKCAAPHSGAELEPFAFFVALGKKGEIRQFTAIPSTKVSDCVILQGTAKIFLSRPPHAPFWLKIEVDPAKLMTASLR